MIFCTEKSPVANILNALANYLCLSIIFILFYFFAFAKNYCRYLEMNMDPSLL